MGAAPEVRAKDRIKRELKKVLDARKLPYKIHFNGGTLTGTPRLDLDGVIAGHPLSIEIKRFDGKGKITGRQKMDVAEYTEAGAFSMIVDSEFTLQVFLVWVRTLEPRREVPSAALEALMKACQ